MKALGRVSKPTKKRVPKEVARLVAKGGAASVDDGFEGGGDVVEGVKRILSTQWGGIPDQLNSDFKEHIEKYRKFVPRIVSRSHLYSLFMDQQSLVDKQVNALLRDHKLVRVQTQNAQIKGDLLMLMDDFLDLLDNQIVAKPDDNSDLLFKFKGFVSRTDTSTSIPKSTLLESFTPTDITSLQQLDFLSLVVRDLDHLLVSVPRFGFIVSLYTKAKQFVTRQLSQSKWKEIKHDELSEKWEKNKTRFKDFKGLHLQWVLHYMIGEGVIEAFETFDGKAYKLI